MKKIAVTATVLAALAFGANAMAEESFSGKITKIDGEKVTVTSEANIPGWVKKGGNVSAMGGMPAVVEVKGKDVVLRFGKAKASKLATDKQMTISEASGDELQGC